jgi:BirA family biotin operon repressor/biotin-[acetyl-CoA-carboxylase] ligase
VAIQTIRIDELDSTMLHARRLASEVSPPFVVIAKRQTAGAGRKGRAWSSPPGGLWLTLTVESPRVEGLSIFAAIPILRALELYFPSIKTKWPNDIVTPDGRKIGGILTEVAGPAYIGIGLNVNNAIPEELVGQAVSLADLTGSPLSLDDLLAEILDQWERSAPLFWREGLIPFRAEYERHLVFQHRTIEIEEGGISRWVFVNGIAPNGALLIGRGGELQATVDAIVIRY